MADTRVTFYEKLVYVAYGFYLIVGATWFILSLYFGHVFNYWAFGTVAIFAVQAYHKHRLTNLILGILALAVSIFWVLEFTWLGQTTGFNLFVKVMLSVFALSVIFGGILIFGYAKLSFKDR